MKGLREKEDKELRKILGETRADLSRISGERASGSQKDSSSSRKKRREVARILTVLKEKEILKQVNERMPSLVENKEPKHGEKAT